MAFLTKEELKTVMYNYQLTQITEGDDTIIEMAIDSAIEEVKSYLTPNNQKQWQDGRLRYDVAAIFSATESNRNSLLLEITKTVAEWWVIRLCNADVIYDHVKERYDRAIEWLTKLAKGVVTLISLSKLAEESESTEAQQPFRFGSRTKFNHE